MIRIVPLRRVVGISPDKVAVEERKVIQLAAGSQETDLILSEAAKKYCLRCSKNVLPVITEIDGTGSTVSLKYLL